MLDRLKPPYSCSPVVDLSLGQSEKTIPQRLKKMLKKSTIDRKSSLSG